MNVFFFCVCMILYYYCHTSTVLNESVIISQQNDRIREIVMYKCAIPLAGNKLIPS